MPILMIISPWCEVAVHVSVVAEHHKALCCIILVQWTLGCVNFNGLWQCKKCSDKWIVKLIHIYTLLKTTVLSISSKQGCVVGQLRVCCYSIGFCLTFIQHVKGCNRFIYNVLCIHVDNSKFYVVHHVSFYIILQVEEILGILSCIRDQRKVQWNKLKSSETREVVYICRYTIQV